MSTSSWLLISISDWYLVAHLDVMMPTRCSVHTSSTRGTTVRSIAALSRERLLRLCLMLSMSMSHPRRLARLPSLISLMHLTSSRLIFNPVLMRHSGAISRHHHLTCIHVFRSHWLGQVIVNLHISIGRLVHVMGQVTGMASRNVPLLVHLDLRGSRKGLLG